VKLNYQSKQQMQMGPQSQPQSSLPCFKCGQMGHIRANCPKLKSGLRTAATRQDEYAEPAMDLAEDPGLGVQKEGEGEPQDEGQNKEIVTDEWERGEAQYQFDDKEDMMEDHTMSYRSSMIRVTLDNDAAPKVMAVCSKPAAPNSVA
jgi:Zinc knuckle